MKCTEVIRVRSAGSSAELLDATLQDLMNAVAIEAQHDAIRIFRHEKLDADICIVLFHSRKKAQAGGSPLGLHLVAALREVGLVSHTIWNEIER